MDMVAIVTPVTTPRSRGNDSSTNEKELGCVSSKQMSTPKTISINGAPKSSTGPDRVFPSEQLYTWEPSGSVKIRDSFKKDEPPISVPTLLKQAAKNFPNYPALAFKGHDERWSFISYREYLRIVRTVAKAFLKLGLKRYQSVCILGSNTPEWPISNLAAIFAGGFSVGIYPSNSAAACLHCLKTSQASIIAVENDAQLQKILEIKDHAPALKVIIQYSGSPTDPRILSWKKVLEIGNNESDDKLDEVINNLMVNQCCALLYTSGTTSLPKAVMLSHDNLVFTAKMTAKHLKLRKTAERCFSYLPFNHIVAQVFDIYLCLVLGSCCYFVDKNVLKSQDAMIKNLKEVRPTYLFGVPRTWEKIKERLQLIDETSSEPEHILAKAPCLTSLRMKGEVGLDKCNTFLVGTAPLSTEVKEYLSRFHIILCEGYGSTEMGSAHISTVDDDFDYESAGKAIPGMRTKIDNANEQGVGEVCFYSRNIFMGYLHDPAKTEEAVDKDGWLHTGDLGKIDEKSCLRICGRMKELLITSGGENVAPILIERALKSELPVLSHATAVGDGKKYISILLTLQCKTDEINGMPLDELTQNVKNWCQSLGCEYETVSDIVRKKPPQIYEAIQRGIDRANLKAISRVHQIRKFVILPNDFSFNTGELGPTSKVMRHIVYKKYTKEIEAMYDSRFSGEEPYY